MGFSKVVPQLKLLADEWFLQTYNIFPNSLEKVLQIAKLEWNFCYTFSSSTLQKVMNHVVLKWKVSSLSRARS